MINHTDRHPERHFFRKSKTFGLGQTNWAEKCREILGIFGQNYTTHLGTVNVFEYLVVVFTEKTLDFWPKTYQSQINPKYDIGHKNF